MRDGDPSGGAARGNDGRWLPCWFYWDIPKGFISYLENYVRSDEPGDGHSHVHCGGYFVTGPKYSAVLRIYFVTMLPMVYFLFIVQPRYNEYYDQVAEVTEQ